MNEQQIVQTYIDWCLQHRIKNENNTQDAVDNANLVWKYMTETWPVEFNRENLDLALSQLRPYLKFYSEKEAAYQSYAEKLTPEQVQLIGDLLGRRGLSTEGENLYTNFIAIAAYLVEKRQPISVESVDRALGNITSNGKAPLIWNRRLQDSEKEALQIRQQPTQALPVDDVKIPDRLRPELHAHYRMMHTPKPEETNKTLKSLDAEYQQRAVDAVASIQNHLDRTEAEQLLSKAGAWGWELTLKAILRYIEKRSHERANVVR